MAVRKVGRPRKAKKKTAKRRIGVAKKKSTVTLGSINKKLNALTKTVKSHGSRISKLESRTKSTRKATAKTRKRKTSRLRLAA